MATDQNFHIVVGLGKTGISCVRYLTAQGLPVLAMDTRAHPPGLAELQAHWPKVPVILGGLDEKSLLQARELVVSPGLSLHEPALAKAMAKGIPAVGDIELFARHAKAPIVAITGSNAKGTVTTLVGDMAHQAGLRVQVGGNIGTPALDLLAEEEPDLYVLELSSFQLETTYSLKAAAATILNISADHLDRYDAMADYIAAKQRIYHNCRAAIFNRDDQATYPDDAVATKISFGLQTPPPDQFGLLQQEGAMWLARGNKPLLATKELRIKGRHNIANALAALALGTAVELPVPPMLEALSRFTGLPHRCQWVAEHAGIHWYNDSKGTNIGATLAAIEGLGADISGKIVLIAGGVGKGADFTVLRPAIAAHVRAVVLIGEDAPLLHKAWQGTTTLLAAASMQKAVQMAHAAAQSGDAVLLSPACASLDMFSNFEERGDIFMAEVRSLFA